MNNMQNSQSEYLNKYYQQLFLQHEAFAEHYARQKMANAANDTAYYQYAELEYYHKSRALHYKGLFSAASTLTDNTIF
ncbi:MAG TPA: hypothetical protein VN258_20665 [Mobilitalea sp.]|nr:hypothetical protein [Mobilitalea sp.]